MSITAGIRSPYWWSGVGLAIARQIVEQHGGGLEVASRPGRTVFTLWLPVSLEPAQTVGQVGTP